MNCHTWLQASKDLRVRKFADSNPLMPAPPTLPRIPRTVWILGFVSLLMDMSSEVYHALLPAFLTITLGLPVVAMGAIDGIAEATASFAKLAAGRLSDRSQRRKPWILLGYGLAALSKPLFPLANGALPVLGARFADRIGKGIRGAPRDAMVADETPPEIRGAAFGLRQTLDTVGALVAPLLAIALMAWLADIRLVFWIAVIPAFLSFLLAFVALREPEKHIHAKPAALFAGFRQINSATRRVILVGFVFSLARFSEGFLILRGLDLGLSMAWSPLVLALFNLGYVLLAFPAGALSDRASPKGILASGIGCLVAADLVLAADNGLAGLTVGVILWGAHMALTQGLFARIVADAAPEDLRATSYGAFHFASGIAALLASLAAGLLWDKGGAAMTFTAGAAVAAMSGLLLLSLPDARPSA